MLFEINASNFQEMFPDIFRNIEMINLEYFQKIMLEGI